MYAEHFLGTVTLSKPSRKALEVCQLFAFFPKLEVFQKSCQQHFFVVTLGEVKVDTDTVIGVCENFFVSET